MPNADQRDQAIYQEALALWQALYDEPPPAVASGSDLLAAVLWAMSERGYSRLTSTSLHHRDIVLPCARQPRS